MYYVKIGDGFTPLEDIKTHRPGELAVLKNTKMARYIERFTHETMELLRIKDGKADYWRYKVSELSLGSSKNDFDVTYSVEQI